MVVAEVVEAEEEAAVVAVEVELVAKAESEALLEGAVDRRPSSSAAALANSAAR